MAEHTEQQLSEFVRALPFLKGYQHDPDFSRWQLDPKDVLELIEHTLRGEVWKSSKDGKSGAWAAMEGVDPLMNEKGIQFVLKKVTAVVNRVVIMSNLEEYAMNEILEDTSFYLSANMIMRFWPNNDWEMDFKDFNEVYWMVMLLVESCLNRAKLDGERKKLYEAQKLQETHVIDQSKEKQSLISMLIPGMGGRK